MHDARIETAVIGSLLISPQTLVLAQRAGVTEDDFTQEDNRNIFTAITTLAERKRTIDPITVGSYLRETQSKDYTTFMLEIMEITPHAGSIEEYCRLLKEETRRRQIEETLNAVTGTMLYGGDWQQATEEAAQRLAELAAARQDTDLQDGASLANTFWTHYQETRKNPEYAYCRTGFSSLDKTLGGGFFRSEMYIVGARPGMGKTTFAANIMNRVADMGKAVLFISLEMTAEQLTAKSIALNTGLSYIRLLTGSLHENEEEMMTNALRRQQEQKAYIVSRSGLTVREIERYARQVDDLALVIIDYIGLIAVEEDEKEKSRYEQMTQISAGIKAMAKRLNVPVMALSQLNRENANRKDKRPDLADLRDSGAIEQDAGGVILLHRPNYYTRAADAAPPAASAPEDFEVIVAKNRHFITDRLVMQWTGENGQIYEQGNQPQRGGDLPF